VLANNSLPAQAAHRPGVLWEAREAARLAGEKAMAYSLPGCPRMRARSLSRRAASHKEHGTS